MAVEAGGAFAALVDDQRVVVSWSYGQGETVFLGAKSGMASGRSSGPSRRPREMRCTSMDLGRWHQPSRLSLADCKRSKTVRHERVAVAEVAPATTSHSATVGRLVRSAQPQAFSSLEARMSASTRHRPLRPGGAPRSAGTRPERPGGLSAPRGRRRPGAERPGVPRPVRARVASWRTLERREGSGTGLRRRAWRRGYCPAEARADLVPREDPYAGARSAGAGRGLSIGLLLASDGS